MEIFFINEFKLLNLFKLAQNSKTLEVISDALFKEGILYNENYYKSSYNNKRDEKLVPGGSLI